MDLFMDEEFDSVSYKKNFYEIMTKDEFWQWMQGPLLAGLYQSTYYNGDTIPDDEQGYILGSLRLVGGVELRQMRVSNSSCSERRYTHFGERFDTKTGVCYAEFKRGAWWTPWLKDTEDTTPFGPPCTYFLRRGRRCVVSLRRCVTCCLGVLTFYPLSSRS